MEFKHLRSSLTKLVCPVFETLSNKKKNGVDHLFLVGGRNGAF